MKFRRAKSVYFDLKDEKIYAYNFLQNTNNCITLKQLSLLLTMDNFIDENHIINFFGESFKMEEILNETSKLIIFGLILQEKSEEEKEDKKYSLTWDWGIRTGSFHFALKNAHFFSGQSDKMKIFSLKMENKQKENPSPPLFSINKNRYNQIQYYPIPQFNHGVFKVIKRRRTIRHFEIGKSIDQEDLAKCLYAGFGIVKFRDSPPLGKLPLKMTPSGGARNPYDAFVLCQNVSGLKNGIYHYSPIEHSLGLVEVQKLINPASILGDQLWINDAAAIIFLVANLDRTMWKYSHPIGYKAVLIEAGHIAQNIILSSNELGFYGSPTAAIDCHLFEQIIREKEINKSCVYAIVMGYAEKDATELL